MIFAVLCPRNGDEGWVNNQTKRHVEVGTSPIEDGTKKLVKTKVLLAFFFWLLGNAIIIFINCTLQAQKGRTEANVPFPFLNWSVSVLEILGTARKLESNLKR